MIPVPFAPDGGLDLESIASLVAGDPGIRGMWSVPMYANPTGYSYTEDEVRALSCWVRDHLGPDVPLHFSAFHPDWKMTDTPATPAATLTRARRIARDEEHLRARDHERRRRDGRWDGGNHGGAG